MTTKNLNRLLDDVSYTVRDLERLFPSCTVFVTGSVALLYQCEGFNRPLHDIDIAIHVPQERRDDIVRQIRNYVIATWFDSGKIADFKLEDNYYYSTISYYLPNKIKGLRVNLLIDECKYYREFCIYRSVNKQLRISLPQYIMFAKQQYIKAAVDAGRAPRQKDLDDIRVILNNITL